MSRNSLSRLVVLGALVLGLAGCADYLNHYDSVTLAGGDAQKHNRLLHAVDPFNPASDDTSIESDGQRTADVIRKYKTSQAPGAAPPTNVTVNVGTATQN